MTVEELAFICARGENNSLPKRRAIEILLRAYEGQIERGCNKGIFPYNMIWREDIYQEVKIDIFQTFEKFIVTVPSFEDLPSWIYTKAKYRAFDLQKVVTEKFPGYRGSKSALTTATSRLKAQGIENPTDEQLLDATMFGEGRRKRRAVSKERLLEIRRAESVFSLDAPMNDKTKKDFYETAVTATKEEIEPKQNPLLKTAMEVLDRIGKREREVIIARDLDGMTPDECAEHLGISYDNAVTSYGKGIKRAKRIIAETEKD